MFLRLRNLVEPVSRGMLVDNLDPDYPPLCFACDEAREQGGIVLWCHNGPALLLRVEGREPGAVLDLRPGHEVEVEVALEGCYPVHRIEIVVNGEVVRTWDRHEGVTEEIFRERVEIVADGWLAARCFSR